MHAILGLHDREKIDGVRYDFSKVLLHPDFTPIQTHDIGDVAIMETDRQIEFSDKIRPICLPKYIGSNYDNIRAFVAGWGRMWSGGKNSQVLQETRVVVQPSDVCRNTHIGRLLDEETMICAYSKAADACQVNEIKIEITQTLKKIVFFSLIFRETVEDLYFMTREGTILCK